MQRVVLRQVDGRQRPNLGTPAVYRWHRHVPQLCVCFRPRHEQNVTSLTHSNRRERKCGWKSWRSESRFQGLLWPSTVLQPPKGSISVAKKAFCLFLKKV